MWRKPTVTDLAHTISQREVDAYRDDGADDGSDPAEKLVITTAALVRSYCRSNGNLVMSPSADEIPESLIGPAMDYAAFQVLKRDDMPVNDARTKAYENALTMFGKVAKGELVPESYGTDVAASAGNVAVEVAASSRRRVTSESLEGL